MFVTYIKSVFFTISISKNKLKLIIQLIRIDHGSYMIISIGFIIILIDIHKYNSHHLDLFQIDFSKGEEGFKLLFINDDVYVTN